MLQDIITAINTLRSMSRQPSDSCVVTGIRMNPLTKLLAYETAAFELRTFSNYIETILIKELIARDLMDQLPLSRNPLSTIRTPNYHEQDIDFFRQRIQEIIKSAPPTKSRRLTGLRLSSRVKMLSQDVAKEENRSFANFVECMVINNLKSLEILTPEILQAIQKDQQKAR